MDSDQQVVNKELSKSLFDPGQPSTHSIADEMRASRVNTHDSPRPPSVGRLYLTQSVFGRFAAVESPTDPTHREKNNLTDLWGN